MDETTKVIRDYYDTAVADEWGRIAGRPEFLLTCRMLDRYIKPGDTILDIGGGPGRYSLYLAEKGCNVTLFDLSAENTNFAMGQAAKQGLAIKAVAGDAREVDKLVKNKFDHVLLMGPLYHLLNEPERVKAVNAALNVLKPSGIFFASFINMFGGMIYLMKTAPELIASMSPAEVKFRANIIARKSYAGDAFTQAFFIEQSEILPFMAQFPLEKLHLLVKRESHRHAKVISCRSRRKLLIYGWIFVKKFGSVKIC